MLNLVWFCCSNSDTEIDVTDGATANSRRSLVAKASGPKPKYHAPGASQGVTAQMARPRFSSSSEDEGKISEEEKSTSDIGSSDLDTDFEAEGLLVNLKQVSW